MTRRIDVGRGVPRLLPSLGGKGSSEGKSARSSALAVAAVALLAACSSQPPRSAGPVVRTAPLTASAPAATPAAKGTPDQRFQAALKLMKENRAAEARAAFQALAQEFPQWSGPLTDLGILQARAGQRDQALANFARAAAANPRNAVAHNWLGSLYREAGDFARAEAAYRRALAAKPGYAEAHLNLGILYDVSLRRPQQALEQYRAYLRHAGKEHLIVSAWIKDLESQLAAAPAPGGGTAIAGAAP